MSASNTSSIENLILKEKIDPDTMCKLSQPLYKLYSSFDVKNYSGHQLTHYVQGMETRKKPILRNDDEKVPVASAILASLLYSKRAARLFLDHRHYRREDFAGPRKFPILDNVTERNYILIARRTIFY